MVGGAVDAKTLRGEESLLRRRLIRVVGLIIGMLVAFLVGGVPGMVAFFVIATVASVLTYLVVDGRTTPGGRLTQNLLPHGHGDRREAEGRRRVRTPPLHAMIPPVLLGFTIIYITLRPVARLLLERDVLPYVYQAVVWSLTLGALLIVAGLTARAAGQPRRRIVTISLLATLGSIAVIGLISAVIVTVAFSAMWLFSEPASILLMLLFACLPALAAAILSAKLPGGRPV